MTPFTIMMRQAVVAIGRRMAWTDPKAMEQTFDDYSNPAYYEGTGMARGKEMNLISSETENGSHAPCIDLDYPAYLVESSTPGHFHLYLEKEISWAKYINVLQAMADAGLIEEGFYRAARSRGATFLRRPGVTK